jgi:nicotinate phosphoribosyltransferase
MLWDELDGPPETPRIVDPANDTRSKSLDGCEARELLVPIFRGGKRVYEVPPLAASRELVQRELASLHDGIKRLKHPHEYPVGLEERLHARRKMMIRDAAAE